MKRNTQKLLLAGAVLLCATQAVAQPENRRALFGETHVHTSLSFDAYIFGNRNGPDAAYRYAKGEAITHPGGFKMQLSAPLDFQAVTDHAMYLGMLPAMFDPNSEVAQHPLAIELRTAKSAAERRTAFAKLFPYIGGLKRDDLLDKDITRSAWQEVIDATRKHNDPGKFTSFFGYEYTTSQNNFENLHRNVIFRGDRAPKIPFSRLDSMNPEDLWDRMDYWRARGMDSIAIPHNSNGSDGFMFAKRTYNGNPITKAYTDQRMRNEPIIELTQVKGTSETHPLLSPNDEFADFEIMNVQIASLLPSRPEGSYARQALIDGMQMDADGKGNPYKFGFIGASDTHVSAGGFDEEYYWSKIGLVDHTGRLRGSVELSWYQRLRVWYLYVTQDLQQLFNTGLTYTGMRGKDPAPGFFNQAWSQWGASGLAGVWAEENTRESIFAAMRRKEVFATSGTRMRVRFFAGYGFSEKMLSDPALVRKAYARGVSMGGDLLANRGRSPRFIAWAMRDPRSQPLQRVQIVKGWVENGKSYERVYDVACAGGAKPDRKTRRCPDNGATVDLATCATSANSGADELKAIWRDPDFDAKQNAVYYVRALENPKCRWSSWDAIREGSPRNPRLKATVQDRVWSSPIWYEN